MKWWTNRAKREKASLVGQRQDDLDKYATYVEEADIWYVYPTMRTKVREASEEKVRGWLEGTDVELIHRWEELPESLQDAVEERVNYENEPDDQSRLEDY